MKIRAQGRKGGQVSGGRQLAVLPAAAVFALVLFPPSAGASFGFSQAESRDPVQQGESVTYTLTVTNQGSEAVETWVSTLTTKPDSDAPVPNPYLDITATQGACAVAPPDQYGYTGGDCSLGLVGPGATVQIIGTVQANYSMEHRVAGFDCDPNASYSHPLACVPAWGTGQSGEETSVAHPPAFSGAEEIALRGFPPSCATADFRVKARAMASRVRSISATLSGPRNEFGGPTDGSSFSERIAKEPSKRVKVRVPAESLDEGFYRLTFVAIRKGSPKLKRIATFQVC